MRTFDFSPFYRSTIGFDRMARLLESASRLSEAENGYPPYNIEAVGEDHYRLTVAVAGFARDELDIELHDGTLTVSGRKAEEGEESHRYLHRGIAGRAFTRRFQLADHVKVEEAALENGVLTVDLIREVPEERKPHRIEIAAGAPKVLADKAKKLLGGDEKKAA